MFVHGKSNKKFYSIKEKINYYKGIINGSIICDAKNKKKSKNQIKIFAKIK